MAASLARDRFNNLSKHVDSGRIDCFAARVDGASNPLENFVRRAGAVDRAARFPGGGSSRAAARSGAVYCRNRSWMVSRLSSVPAACQQPLDQLVFGHVECQHQVERHAALGQHAIERFGLRHRAGKAVEQAAVGAIGLRQPLDDDADDDVVGHQLAGVHVVGGLRPSGVPASSASRSISPVDRWAMPR